MTVTTVAHLNFDGTAREALEFYAHAFDGELMTVSYSQAGMPAGAADVDRIMFGQVVGANGFTVMAYDVPRTGGEGLLGAAGEPTTRRENGLTFTTSPFFLSVRGETAEEIAPMWERLQAGATVLQEFGPVPWSPGYGMLRDRYGVTWMLDVAVAYNG